MVGDNGYSTSVEGGDVKAVDMNEHYSRRTQLESVRSTPEGRGVKRPAIGDCSRVPWVLRNQAA